MEFLANVDHDVLDLHDGSRAFKPKGTAIFNIIEFKRHERYLPSVPQYLSPNDFHLHGCKSTWSQGYSKCPDEVCATLRLMQLIDIDTIENSKGYFQKNILCAKKSDFRRVLGTWTSPPRIASTL